MKKLLILAVVATIALGAFEPGQSWIEGKTWFRMNMERYDGETEAMGFEVARGYFTFGHQFTPTISGKFNVDIYSSDKSSDANGAGLKIKAAYLEYSGILPDAKLQAGVIKNYFGTIYDWSYLTIEKAPEDLNGITTSADAGVALAGYIPSGFGEYQLGVYNGGGYKKYNGNIDVNPAFVANVRFIPISGVTLGGSMHFSQYEIATDTLGGTENKNDMKIAGVLRGAYGPAELWGEYLMRKQDETQSSCIMVMPVVTFANRFQILGRYDIWDPNADVDDDGYNLMVVGANYFLSKNTPSTQIQVNWERATPELADAEPTDNFSVQLRWEFKSNPF